MKNYLFLLSLFLFISCNNDDDMNEEPAIQTGPVAFTTISQGRLNGNEGVVQSNLVINNASDWIALMNQMDSGFNNFTGDFTQTNIDFNNFTVIAIFEDVLPEFYLLEITSIIENQNYIEVTTVIDGGGFTSLSQPFHIVKIPKTAKPFVFL
ncbi:hypothetical protein LX97_00327 [Nonlabens dokdonensis]|jgi:hypothetical protein|uniref:PrcB C-terminal domain-containing protein n=2 Tax=Nonlabens dokdonensis TaxID=328515 RepID=L7W765_NONDD|nr:hypothetical protein [Nonlabens dokdonensis]AGC75636.1 hypothetical protein DDD_0509 [Nonlabens dokdonensis DSW-6]PZX43327.1 hypothetical protein LX97_00327 [Nonlabens dokdonensis]